MLRSFILEQLVLNHPKVFNTRYSNGNNNLTEVIRLPLDDLLSVLYKFINTDSVPLVESYQVYTKYNISKASNIKPKLRNIDADQNTKPKSSQSCNINVDQNVLSIVNQNITPTYSPPKEVKNQQGSPCLLFKEIAVLKSCVTNNRYVTIRSNGSVADIDMQNCISCKNKEPKLIDDVTISQIKSNYEKWGVNMLRRQIPETLDGSCDKNTLEKELKAFYKSLIEHYESNKPYYTFNPYCGHYYSPKYLLTNYSYMFYSPSQIVE